MKTIQQFNFAKLDAVPTGIFKISCMILLMLALQQTSFAQKDFSDELKKDLVTVASGQYSINDFSLVHIGEVEFQIQMSAIAPVDVMSRDNFVTIFSTIGTVMMLALLDEAGYTLAEVDIKDLDELIGEPDWVFNIVMAKNGLQIQIITDEGTTRSTMTWDDLFEQ